MQKLFLTTRPVSRRGIILLVIMICLVLITAMTGSMLKTVMFQHRQMKQEQLHHQARWLLASGLERAAYRLQRDENYPGETWSLAAEQLQSAYSGEVKIRIEPVDADDNAASSAVRMTVTVRYPLESQTLQLFQVQIIPRKVPPGENP